MSGEAILVIPPATSTELMRALRISAEKFGVGYLWLHGDHAPIGVVMSASEFRRLKDAAGEALVERHDGDHIPEEAPSG